MSGISDAHMSCTAFGIVILPVAGESEAQGPLALVGANGDELTRKSH